MTSPEVQRLAKWGQCEGCLCMGLLQPWGPEGERLCESCCEALWMPTGRDVVLTIGGFVGFVMLVFGVAQWLTGRW